MKRRGWLFTTFAALFLSGAALTPAGAPEAPAPCPAPAGNRGEAGPARTADLFASPAARRWYDGQPHHWHACLLQQ